MKKGFIYFLLSVFLYSISFGAGKYEKMRWERSMILYKELGIKSLKLTYFDFEFGVPTRVGSTVKDIVFDENYRIIESRIYDDDEYDGKINYIYNSIGDTIQISFFDKAGIEMKKYEFKYNSAGKLSEKIYYEEGEMFNKDILVYDDKGNKTEFQKWGHTEFEYKIQYIYDDQNREVEWAFYNDENLMEQKGVTSYNPNGQVADSTYYFEGLVDAKAIYSYDDKGRVTQFRLNSGNGDLFYRVEFKYNLAGLLSEERKYDDQDVMVELFYIEYNIDGQVLQISRHLEGEFLEDIWKFKYHLNGLCKEEHYLNKIEITQFMRKFTYEPEQH